MADEHRSDPSRADKSRGTPVPKTGSANRATEKALFETLGVTRSDLQQGLADFRKTDAQAEPAIRQIQSNEQDLVRPSPAATTTSLPAKGFVQGLTDVPASGNTPLPQTPQTAVAVTGILNGVPASWTAYGQGVPVAL